MTTPFGMVKMSSATFYGHLEKTPPLSGIITCLQKIVKHIWDKKDPAFLGAGFG
jgi:hypothetical protein